MILKSNTTGSAHLLWVQPRGQRDDPDIAWAIARIGNPQINPPCPSSSSVGFSSSGPSGSVSSGSSGDSSSGGSGSGSSSGSSSAGGGGSSGGGGPGNCFVYGTLVRLTDGSLVPIERLEPGDLVASLNIPGLVRDAGYKAQYEWRVQRDADEPSPRPARVGIVRHGTHGGFYLLNGRVKATFEHPFMIRRGDETGFCSAELLRVGDRLVGHDLAEEPIVSIQRVDRTVRTVALHVPGTNVYLADGVWVHNDTEGSGSASGSGSLSSKSSGSSFGGPPSSSSSSAVGSSIGGF